MERWSGRVAVVTGASGGIGASTALALADAGFRVVGLARRPHLIDDLRTQIKGKGSITSRRCDLSKPQDVEQAFKWIEEEFGGTDVIVNNAALFIHGHITDVGSHTLSEEELISVLDVNLKGVILCTRHAVSSMKKRGFAGHVININSIAGHYVPLSSLFNVYSSTKYGITAFTQALADEMADFKTNIKTTSISPGLVATDMVKTDRVAGVQDAVSSLPALEPRDIAGAVLYALSTPPNVNITELTIAPIGEKRL